MKKIVLVAGARPNFMKIASIIDALNVHNKVKKSKIEYQIVHTGQHYDQKMSKLFFEELEIPKPDIELEVGSASHAQQTAEIMKRFEKVCIYEKPTHILVVGDVNSTIACALVASKLNIKIIHVEAGLRSFDRTMPEEINRILTDAISDILFVTEESGSKNLIKEGISEDKIFFVGNVMIDTLMKHKSKAMKSNIDKIIGLTDRNNVQQSYSVLTLHRPSNVDNEKALVGILDAIKELSSEIPVVFPIHPRTLKMVRKYNIDEYFEWSKYSLNDSNLVENKIYAIPPLGYLEFLKIMSSSKLVFTDSGGIQEESTILGIPCVTIRENTERPVTITKGTNILAGTKKDNIIKSSKTQLVKNNYNKNIPPLWDGQAAGRIINILSGSF
ncbi:non-hydrolyzing UDP-N-acetylglucosamine 2-epimerase [Thermodesulfobacteriota bacterium]